MLRATVTLLVLLAASVVGAAKRGQVELRVVDSKSGELIAARMHLSDQKGKVVKPPKTIFWNDHFLIDGSITLELAAGTYTFELQRGPEYKIRTGYFTMEDGATDIKELSMERFIDMTADGWYSGDLLLQRTPAEIEAILRAEDLHFAPVITWSSKLAPKMVDAEPHTCDTNRLYQLLGGRDDRDPSGLLFFNLTKPLELTDLAKEHPSSAALLREAKESSAFTVLDRANSWDLPMLVATGQLDAVLLAGSDVQSEGAPTKELPGKPRPAIRYPGPQASGRWSQDIYYQLLNAGIRLPPAAGSGSGLGPNPAGYNRVYVHCEGEFTSEKWWQGLKAGRVVVTNGPVMQPRVDGHLPGHVFQADQGQTLELSISLNLSTREKIEYLEVVHNGKVAHEVRLDKWAEANGTLPPIKFTESGWMLVRAVTANEATYRYATSGPFYVQIGYRNHISKSAAQFFSEWTRERAKQIKLDDPAQREAVISYHRNARDFWQKRLDDANAE